MKLSKVAREISTQGIGNEISREAKEDEALAASTWNEVVVVGLDLLHSRLDFQVW
jgi:predicted N-acetyltransferase YhbS